MSTITAEQQARIAAWLDEHPVLSVGVGTEESACSVAAINLALTGTLTDEIPECMSEVIGQWIIVVQDEMPAEIRNSAEWRGLLPLAAGTGREHERERREIIWQWMIDALERIQHVADKGGYGKPWAEAIRVSRTSTSPQSRQAAWDTAWGAGRVVGAWNTAWYIAWDAAKVAGMIMDGDAAEYAADDAARRAAEVAARDAARRAADLAGRDPVWDPDWSADWETAWNAAWDTAKAAFHAANDYPGLLRKLIAVSEPTP